MLIRNTEVNGGRCDVRVEGEWVAEIAPALPSQSNEHVVDASGGALLPGLHDHHIHLQATAAAMQSIRCGPPEVENTDALAAALLNAPGHGWLRGVGYHDSIGVEIDRAWLDRNGPDRPIRIQHRGGRMWVLNSKAIDLLALDVPANGRVIDRDAELREALSSTRPDMQPLVEHLLSRGVTGLTETTPGNDRSDFAYLATKCHPLRLLIMGGTDLHQADPLSNAQIGPLKLHYHDHDLPSLEHLAGEITDAHNQGRNAAMHCVTRAEIMLGLAAFEHASVRAGDRLEHGAIADEMIVEWIARLGLTVVTQPHFVSERAEAYLAEVEANELPHLWPLKRFMDANIALAAGSDAPFGGLDPWQVMAGATRRPSSLSPQEAITPEDALALYTKPSDRADGAPRKVEVGAIADLCLIDRAWRDAREELSDVQVRATWIGGEVVYETS